MTALSLEKPIATKLLSKLPSACIDEDGREDVDAAPELGLEDEDDPGVPPWVFPMVMRGYVGVPRPVTFAIPAVGRFEKAAPVY